MPTVLPSGAPRRQSEAVDASAGMPTGATRPCHTSPQSSLTENAAVQAARYVPGLVDAVRTPSRHDARQPQIMTESRELEFLRAQHGIMLQEIERLRSANIEGVRAMDAVESAAQDLSSETQLALLITKNKSEQQRMQLLAAEQLLQKLSAENERLQKELDSTLNMLLTGKQAVDCGNENDRLEIRRLKLELHALKADLVAETTKNNIATSGGSESGNGDRMSSFLARTQEKRKQFFGMLKSPAAGIMSPYGHLADNTLVNREGRDEVASLKCEECGTVLECKLCGGAAKEFKKECRYRCTLGSSTREMLFVSSSLAFDDDTDPFAKVDDYMATVEGRGPGQEADSSTKNVSDTMESPTMQQAIQEIPRSHSLSDGSEQDYGEVVHTVTTDHAHKAQAISLVLTLDLSMNSIGEDRSTRRAVFNLRLTADLAKASGVSESYFKIKSITAGSVIVAVEILRNPNKSSHDPSEVAKDLEQQAGDSTSILRSGAITANLVGLKLSAAHFSQHGDEDCKESEPPPSQVDRSNTPSTLGHLCQLETTAESIICPSYLSRNRNEAREDASHLLEKVKILELKLAGKEAELAREKTQDQYKLEEALSILQQRMETKYTQLIWKQMQAHEEVVQQLTRNLTSKWP